MIAVRLVWLPLPGERGAFRVRDLTLWETARWCRRCGCLGYDHGDVDSLLEARRLGVGHAPRVVTACVPHCEPAGGTSLSLFIEGPR